jgi:sulfhydrogenase subunit beta (sulfur reductase)
MTDKILKKNDLEPILNDLIANYRVYAPVKEPEMVIFKEIEKAEDAYLDYTNSKRSPKYVFLPQFEEMFEFRKGEEGIEVDTPDDIYQKTVLFGVRPCDAMAASMLDSVFDWGEEDDIYYLARRENTTVVGLACLNPSSLCFCTSMGGGPFATRGLDILLVDLGNRYLVRSITEKGEALISQWKDGGSLPSTPPILFEGLIEADEADREAAERLEKEAIAKIKSEVKLEGVKEKLDGMFEDPYWDTLHLRCIGCGVCTYLCPTCHCFDITDEMRGRRGVRVRTWDSCMFPLFTLHTSGHNPRNSGKERMRQRVMHKFNYFVEKFGDTACVGCGRCVRYCPVNIDIRAIINEISEMEIGDR